jgi:hypothetical protein
MIEYASIDIAIGGDARATIRKQPVSIPEIVLLRAVHGDDAVTNIRILGTWDCDDDTERDRLGNFYKDTTVQRIFQQYGPLPKNLKEARIPDVLLDPLYAKEVSGSKPVAKKTTRKRARNTDGSFKADDPSTPENEAWEE